MWIGNDSPQKEAGRDGNGGKMTMPAPIENQSRHEGRIDGCWVQFCLMGHNRDKDDAMGNMQAKARPQQTQPKGTQ